MSITKVLGVLLALTLFANGQSASIILDGQLPVGLMASIPAGPVTGMAAWYSADCITFTSSVCGTPANGASISAWADHSGNADNLSGITGTCTFNTSQINSKPAVQFSSCAFDLASTVSPSVTGQLTIFVVYKRANTTSKGDFTSQISSTGTKYWTDGAVKMQGLTDSALRGTGTASADINWHQMNVFLEDSTHGNSLAFRLDRASDGSSAPSVSSIGGIGTVGADRTTGTNFLDGKLAELIIYTTALTPAQITQNEAYLHGKYGL